MTEVNVVATGEQNPTILQSAFLTAAGIVPADWRVVDPPISTPFLSFVRFDSRVVFFVDPLKFQVSHSNPDEASASTVARLAEEYLSRTAPFACTGLGVNVTGYFAVPSSIDALIGAYLRNVSLRGSDPVDASIKLGYNAAGPRGEVLNLTFSTGQAAPGEPAGPAVILFANYHLDVPGRPSNEIAHEIVDRFHDDLAAFDGIIGAIENVLMVAQ